MKIIPVAALLVAAELLAGEIRANAPKAIDQLQDSGAVAQEPLVVRSAVPVGAADGIAGKDCPDLSGKYVYVAQNRPGSSCLASGIDEVRFSSWLDENASLPENSIFEIRQLSCRELRFYMPQYPLNSHAVQEYAAVVHTLWMTRRATKEDSTRVRMSWMGGRLVYEEKSSGNAKTEGVRVISRGYSRMEWKLTDAKKLSYHAQETAYGLIGPLPVLDRKHIECGFERAAPGAAVGFLGKQ